VPRIEATTTLPVRVEEAFALSQSQGEVRYAWDPFVRTQRLLDGAARPGKGVRTETRSRHHLTMVSEYTSFRPPTQVGMKMVRGPRAARAGRRGLRRSVASAVRLAVGESACSRVVQQRESRRPRHVATTPGG